MSSWKFAELDQKQRDLFSEVGLHDAGIEIFAGDKITGLVRECLQNSLDAAKDDSKPVIVSFRNSQLSFADLEADSLEQHLRIVSKQEAGRDKSEALREAVDLLQKPPSMPAIEITDRNTTGATDIPPESLWERLTKNSGKSNSDNSRLGSFGIGKRAAFAASPLRTVLYSTRWETKQGKPQYRFRGHSVLATHKFKEKLWGHDGFLGDNVGSSVKDLNAIPPPPQTRRAGTQAHCSRSRISRNRGFADCRQEFLRCHSPQKSNC